jgi:multisubunit Na+/H+ antiporter MnhB subunit
MSIAFDLSLAVLLLAVAIWAITVRDAFASVISFIVCGSLLAIIWVALAAIDVAMTEAAIGSGLTGALLLGAAARLRAARPAKEYPGAALRVAAAMLSATVGGLLVAGILLLPEPAPTLAPLALENAAATGLSNPVTNVLMAFRALDTMLEKVVLLLALAGVWSLAPDSFWGGRPGPRHPADPQGLLAFFVRLLPPLGIVIGVHLLWVSADHPGGAFQGGTVLAAMWILVMIAGLALAPPVSSRRLRLVLIAGPLVFVLVGLGGMWFGAAFLAYPVAFAKPLILTIEFAMLLTIAATLGLLVAGPPGQAAS